MVQGVGGTGNSGSLNNMYEYQVYYPDYLEYKKNNPESSVNFEGWLIMKGKMAYFTQQMENYVETGNSNTGDGVSGNTLDGMKHVSSASGAIYQSEDEDTYYQFDYDTGEYRVLHGNDEIKAALGLSEDQNIDMIEFGHWAANIIDITFGDLDDGQDTTYYNVNSKYTNVTLTDQEFDIHYILNALMMDPSDPQYQIAKSVFDKLCANADQWLPQTDLDMLNEVAEKYGTNSAEYKAVLKDVLLSNLDQANEWVEDHAHVKTGASLEELGSTTSTDGSSDSSEAGSVPDYDKIDVLTDAGLANAYSRGDKRTVESTDNSEGNRRKELQAQMDADLDTIANALASSLGDQLTSEMQTYINKAKATVAGKEELISTWSKHHGFMGMHKKTGGEYSIKEVADAFFNEFNTLCANNGKTTEEVAAEQKAAEEKSAKEESVYKNLYNMDMQSTARSVGADKDAQAVNVSSAAEIQAKAESSILNPLITQIKAKLAGQGVSDADMTTLLQGAADYALSYCTEWASTSNNYVYTIDADKLISKFEEGVKASIKNKGYSF